MKGASSFGGGGGQSVHGSARWMDTAEAAALGLDDLRGVLLGQKQSGELLRFDGDGHVMVFAPTGAGKGIGFVQPNLAAYGGSMVVLDPKGENVIVSADHRRRMGQRVLVLDPFGMTGKETDTYNPLSALTFADAHSLGPMIETLADALIVTKEEKDRHWTDGGRKFVSLLMWWLVAHEAPENRNLVRLYELAHGGYDLLTRIATVMREGRSPDPEIARVCRAMGNWFLGRQPREFSYFESVASNHLGWIGDSVWSHTLGGAPSPPLPLKTLDGGMTVYLVLPFHRMERYQSWLRLMVADLLYSLYDIQGVPNNGPVVFMLDEAFAALGRMEIVFSAAAAVRSAGARLVFIYQDVEQVEKLYGNAWQSLVANSGVTLFWSVNDLKAADFISRRCGQKTTPVPGSPVGMAEPLIRVEAVMQLPADEVIALFRNSHPAKFGRMNVRTDARFSPQLAPNTTYGLAVEKSYTARTDFVPVDLGSVNAARFTADDEEGETPSSAAPSIYENIAAVTGLPVKLLRSMEEQFGHPLQLRGNELGYLDEGGAFCVVASPG